MKKLIWFVVFIFVSGGLRAQEAGNASVPDTLNTAKVYVIRSTGHVGSAVNFRVIVDSSMACKIRNNRYAVMYVEPGDHRFYATSWDAPATKENLGLQLPLEAGKTYYLTIRLKQRFFGLEIFIDEITLNTARPLLEKYERAEGCD